jgi:hypothetical protein
MLRGSSDRSWTERTSHAVRVSALVLAGFVLSLLLTCGATAFYASPHPLRLPGCTIIGPRCRGVVGVVVTSPAGAAGSPRVWLTGSGAPDGFFAFRVTTPSALLTISAMDGPTTIEPAGAAPGPPRASVRFYGGVRAPAHVVTGRHCWERRGLTVVSQ